MVKEGIAEIITNDLQPVLGERLTALVAGEKNVESVREWGMGNQIPQRNQEWRLRLGNRVTHMLLATEAPETIKAWFICMDPFLEDRAPALVISEARKGSKRITQSRVLQAAWAFLAE